MNQREIKFRAILNEEAVSNGRYTHTNRIIYFTLEDVIRGKFTLVYPEHWQVVRFTGLKDKNGKEIYEGDVVKTKTTAWEVKFDRGMFHIADDKSVLYPLPTFLLEVIGNIYENPELLK